MKLSWFSTIMLFGVLVIAGIFFDSEANPTADTAISRHLPEPQIQIPATAPAPRAPSLNARYACVMDADSGRILYNKKSEEKVPMASTTKIMTALLVLESHRQADTVTSSSRASSMPKVRLGMRAGMQYRMSDLLYSLMLESHNDTAVAIAEHIGHSVEGFASLMNKKAAEIGLSQTHFVTPNGLDADGHYSTAADMCRLAAYAVRNKDFLSLVQTKSHTFSDISGKHRYSLSNKDAFLSYYEGALGIKTGFTNKAGYCFVGAAGRSGITLTSCVLASGWPPNKSYKWVDTKSLMDYGFGNFYRTELPIQDLSKAVIPVMDGRQESVSLRPLPKIPVLLSRSDRLTITYDIPDTLYAHVRKETAVGLVSFYINDTLYRKEKVFPLESIEKSDFSDTIDKVFNIWMDVFGF